MKRRLSLAACALLLAACGSLPDRDPQLERLLAYRELVRSTVAAGDWMLDAWRQLSADDDFAAMIQASARRIRPDSRIICPRRIDGEFPAYPSARRVDLQEAVLMVALIVDAEGRIRKVRHVPHPRIVAESPYVKAALDAIGGWTFSKGSIDGEPADFAMLQTIAFQLEQGVFNMKELDGGDARCRKTDVAALP